MTVRSRWFKNVLGPARMRSAALRVALFQAVWLASCSIGQVPVSRNSIDAQNQGYVRVEVPRYEESILSVEVRPGFHTRDQVVQVVLHLSALGYQENVSFQYDPNQDQLRISVEIPMELALLDRKIEGKLEVSFFQYSHVEGYDGLKKKLDLDKYDLKRVDIPFYLDTKYRGPLKACPSPMRNVHGMDGAAYQTVCREIAGLNDAQRKRILERATPAFISRLSLGDIQQYVLTVRDLAASH